MKYVLCLQSYIAYNIEDHLDCPVSTLRCVRLLALLHTQKLRYRVWGVAYVDYSFVLKPSKDLIRIAGPANQSILQDARSSNC